MSAAAARDTRRLGLFGGSFNPPHFGHRDLVATLLAHDLVDEVWVVPVYEHPFGKVLARFADRLEMCRLTFADLDAVQVSPIEEQLGGRSYTVRTLEALHHERPADEIYLVVGADALRDVDHWHDFARVKALARLLVVPRQGAASPEAIAVPPPRDVSSREVRRRIAGGEPLAGMVAAEVLAYIERRGLYRGAPPTTQPGDER